MHIYASYEMAKFIPWPPDKRRVSFFHIVNWFKNLLIRLFTVAWHWVTLGDNRKSLYCHPQTTDYQIAILSGDNSDIILKEKDSYNS